MALSSQRFGRQQRLQSAAVNHPPLRQGANGDAVKTLQASFVELGYEMPISTHHRKIHADGIYGRETANVVKQFQVEQGLDADGVAGKDTLTRLDQIYVQREAHDAMKARFREMLTSFWT